MIIFLQSANASTITEYSYSIPFETQNNIFDIYFTWAPVIETNTAHEAILIEKPEAIFNKPNFTSNVDIMFGLTTAVS